jgi:hypothetical protein
MAETSRVSDVKAAINFLHAEFHNERLRHIDCDFGVGCSHHLLARSFVRSFIGMSRSSSRLLYCGAHYPFTMEHGS